MSDTKTMWVVVTTYNSSYDGTDTTVALFDTHELAAAYATNEVEITTCWLLGTDSDIETIARVRGENPEACKPGYWLKAHCEVWWVEAYGAEVAVYLSLQPINPQPKEY